MKARTMKRFTCDELIRASAHIRRQKAAKANPAKVQTPTTDEKPVDLNEVHRRFWAKLAGKE